MVKIGEVNILPSPRVGVREAPSNSLKKSKSLSFVGKGKFLKSGSVKGNDENMMKSNDGIPSHHGSENEDRCLNDSLNMNIARKKINSVAS